MSETFLVLNCFFFRFLHASSTIQEENINLIKITLKFIVIFEKKFVYLNLNFSLNNQIDHFYFLSQFQILIPMSVKVSLAKISNNLKFCFVLKASLIHFRDFLLLIKIYYHFCYCKLKLNVYLIFTVITPIRASDLLATYCSLYLHYSIKALATTYK